MIKQILLTTLLLTTSYSSVINCDKDSEFQIYELSQTPELYVRGGDEVSLTLKYHSDREIEEGYISTSVTLNGIPFSPSIEDLCKSISCPLSPGDHDGSTTGIFPSGITGKIVSKVEWYDSFDNLLLCIESTMKVTSLLRGSYSLTDDSSTFTGFTETD